MYLYTNLYFPHPWWEGHLLFYFMMIIVYGNPRGSLYCIYLQYCFYFIMIYLLEASQGLKHLNPLN